MNCSLTTFTHTRASFLSLLPLLSKTIVLRSKSYMLHQLRGNFTVDSEVQPHLKIFRFSLLFWAFENNSQIQIYCCWVYFVCSVWFCPLWEKNTQKLTFFEKKTFWIKNYRREWMKRESGREENANLIYFHIILCEHENIFSFFMHIAYGLNCLSKIAMNFSWARENLITINIHNPLKWSNWEYEGR